MQTRDVESQLETEVQPSVPPFDVFPAVTVTQFIVFFLSICHYLGVQTWCVVPATYCKVAGILFFNTFFDYSKLF